MSGTRVKIIRAARLLFNTQGVAKVSQRAIAEHIAISPGNLTYHFKKRDDIIEALYFELAEAMDHVFSRVEGEYPSIEMLFSLTQAMHKELFENRFFMIDFIQILRSNTKIQKHFIGLSEKRGQQTKHLITSFIESDIMRKEELPNEYDHLYRRMQLFGDFWISSIGTTEEEVMLKHTRIYTEMFMQSLYPYFTEKGKADFKRVMAY